MDMLEAGPDTPGAGLGMQEVEPDKSEAELDQVAHDVVHAVLDVPLVEQFP